MSDFILLQREMDDLKKTTSWFNIGKTEKNNNIICFKIGNTNSKIKYLFQAGIHAREYITSFLLIKLIRFIKNINIDVLIYIIPISNPDGIDICLNGLKNVLSKIERKEIKKNIFDNRLNFNLIKSNVRGVDLNTNFDALWGKGKSNMLDKPYYQNFIGFYKNSERETKSLINMVNLVNPNLTLSFHSKGEVIYYGFPIMPNKKKYKITDRKIIKMLKKNTKYKFKKTKKSCGGFKDYCIMKKGILSYTVEVGSDDLTHPIKSNKLDEIFNDNINFILALLKIT